MLGRTVQRMLAGMMSSASLAKTAAWLAKTHIWSDNAATQTLRKTVRPDTPLADTLGRKALQALLESTAYQGALTVGETLGEGGMGIVRLGTQHSLGRKVAVKSIREGHASEAATMALLREAWVTGALEHPNILPVYDVTVDGDGQPQVVLKRVEGVTWEQLMFAPTEMDRYLGEGDLLEHNLRTLMKVCNALSLAHSRNVIHRDVKPENVMLGRFGEVYLVDWGLALSLVDDPSGRLPTSSRNMQPAGTPAYMAPEMLGSQNPLTNGEEQVPALSLRTDIYLVGAVLFELLCGQPPHNGATMLQVVSSMLLSNPKLPPNIPASLATVVRRCMRADPAERYESCEQVRVALDNYLQHRGSARLVQDAAEQHRALDAQLAHNGPSDKKRQALYHLFGAARFGYQAALAAWPDNQTAHTRLEGLVTSLVKHELSEKQPHAAAALLAALPTPPTALQGDVEQALRVRSDEDARRTDLERNLDMRVGQRTRQFAAAVLALLWTASALLALFWGSAESHAWFTGWGMPLLSLLVGGALVIWARDSLTGSEVNRRFVISMALILLSQLLLSLGLLLLDLRMELRLPMYIFLWAVVCTQLTIHIERRLAPVALGYAIAFLVTCVRPEWFYLCAAITNLLAAGLVAWTWRGASVAAQPRVG